MSLEAPLSAHYTPRHFHKYRPSTPASSPPNPLVMATAAATAAALASSYSPEPVTDAHIAPADTQLVSNGHPASAILGSSVTDASLEGTTPLTGVTIIQPPLPSAASQTEVLPRDAVSEVDAQIVEALKSKDRLFVLKLGEQLESLILERKPRIDLHPTSSYQRLLVHRCAAYYKCLPENDPNNTKGLIVFSTMESKIPARRLVELVPAEATAQPAFKIMRRSSRDRIKSKASSTAGSIADGDDGGEASDHDNPSETSSLYSRGSTTRKHLTIEQREAAYQQARTRIFQDFVEKERDADKETSTSSSISAISASASTSGAGSDLEADSVTTESEWSVPTGRERKDGRRGGGSGNSSQNPGRSSWRPRATPNSRSARGSRATSPSSFSYASIYEPSPPPFDTPHQPGAPPPSGYMNYPYPYGPTPNQAPGQPHLAPYPYYPQYPGYPTTHHSDPVSPAATDLYPQHGQQPLYQPHHAYAWPPPPPAGGMSPAHMPTSPMHQPPASPIAGHSMAYPPPAGYMPHPPQAHPGYPPYTVPPGYYPPPPPPAAGMMPPPSLPGQVYAGHPPMQQQDATSPGSGNHSRTSSRNSSQGRRSAPPVRSAWSYGPGIATPMGGYHGQDVVGPRLNTSMRRMSGASSVGSGSTGNRTPGGDDASSTVSSSTSSSSAQTFKSTSTSSKHPLPARPDWAIGLRPDGSGAHRHHDSNGRTGVPTASGMRTAPTQPPQPTDFPPLGAAPAAPRAPVAGAWTNTSRTILAPSNGSGTTPTKAILQHPHGQGPASQVSQAPIGEQDRTFERPPPKGNPELFNPKGLLKKPNGSTAKALESGSSPTDAVSPAASSSLDAELAANIGALTVSESASS